MHLLLARSIFGFGLESSHGGLMTRAVRGVGGVDGCAHVEPRVQRFECRGTLQSLQIRGRRPRPRGHRGRPSKSMRSPRVVAAPSDPIASGRREGRPPAAEQHPPSSSDQAQRAEMGKEMGQVQKSRKCFIYITCPVSRVACIACGHVWRRSNLCPCSLPLLARHFASVKCVNSLWFSRV